MQQTRVVSQRWPDVSAVPNAHHRSLIEERREAVKQNLRNFLSFENKRKHLFGGSSRIFSENKNKLLEFEKIADETAYQSEILT